MGNKVINKHVNIFPCGLQLYKTAKGERKRDVYSTDADEPWHKIPQFHRTEFKHVKACKGDNAMDVFPSPHELAREKNTSLIGT